MRRIAWIALVALVLLIVPASALAAVTTTSDPAALAGTLGGGTAVGTATFAEQPGTGTPYGIGDSALGGFPTEGGTFAILTSGDASLADADNTTTDPSVSLGSGPAHGFAGAAGNAYDTSVLQIPVTVPEGDNCLSLDFRFLSEEYPDNVGGSVNDGFLAMLDSAQGTADPNGDISAPTNFAFDQNGALVSINTAAMSTDAATGTGYNAATNLLKAQSPVTPGAHTLYLAIFDQGDNVLDSAVFVDNLAFSNAAAGACGGAVDRDAPAVALTGPADGAQVDSAPTYAGVAGAAGTDSQNVTVQVYSGSTVAGVPTEIVTAARQADGSWVTSSGGLDPGTYTAQAHQTDTAGNVGASAPVTFTVVGDDVAPTVRITRPADGSSTDDASPTIAGTAGNAPGDADVIDVTLRSGPSVVQRLTADRTGTTWSVDADQLAPGGYTAQASQDDGAGNVGTSPFVAFTVTTPPSPAPTPQQQVGATATPSPQPTLGQTVVAGAVSGTVKVKGKDGRFHTLGANEAIPLGSTVDATKGRVRLTAAAGPSGQVQTGDFYQGAFVVTQTGGKKPITQLALAGALTCSTKGKASAAAKRRKVRRLWGDGHGAFRTRGRRAAATVRGTKWLTEDRCDSTKITVKRGIVSVRDYVKRKTVLVKKGHSYVAQVKKKRKP